MRMVISSETFNIALFIRVFWPYGSKGCTKYWCWIEILWIDLPGPYVDAWDFKPVMPSAGISSLSFWSCAYPMAMGFAILPASAVRTTIVKIKATSVHMGLHREGSTSGSCAGWGGITSGWCRCIHTPEKNILSFRPLDIGIAYLPSPVASHEHILYHPRYSQLIQYFS